MVYADCGEYRWGGEYGEKSGGVGKKAREIEQMLFFPPNGYNIEK